MNGIRKLHSSHQYSPMLTLSWRAVLKVLPSLSISTVAPTFAPGHSILAHSIYGWYASLQGFRWLFVIFFWLKNPVHIFKPVFCEQPVHDYLAVFWGRSKCRPAYCELVKGCLKTINTCYGIEMEHVTGPGKRETKLLSFWRGRNEPPPPPAPYNGWFQADFWFEPEGVVP